MLPKILKNFNVFVDGRGYAGKIDEITLPKLTIKTEEYRAGGMDIPINIDMGMEKLEADFTFAEYDWLCCIATYERLTIARIISNLLKILFFCNQSDQI
ncbi:phage major tail tube protein [Wolbachia endosymbiont (group A) of Portevinia maculata]|uniref:phage major tail tube protein n=1 Tax=Wolbachia endosymbiont (group A) of Portevinia maculata TaxID=3066155 RepID=UPI00397C740C